jgi:hypothetical protein
MVEKVYSDPNGTDLSKLVDISAHPEREAVEGSGAKPFDRLRVSGSHGLK